MWQLVSAICGIAGDDVYIFHGTTMHQHIAVHGGTAELLRPKAPQFINPDIWPANSSHLSPVDYRRCSVEWIGAFMYSTNPGYG